MTNGNTTDNQAMATEKIAISMDRCTLERIDELIAKQTYPNRSRAIEAAVRDKLDRLDRNRLARECAQLDVAAEKAMAETGMAADLETWPKY